MDGVIAQQTWIRINQLGYTTRGLKHAVWASKDIPKLQSFRLVDDVTGEVVFKGKVGKQFGAYGPFSYTYRLDFSSWQKGGAYHLEAGGIRSPAFRIGDDVYAGAADFVLRYMRQQRTLFNPFLQDSCHTHDGFTLYASTAGLPDSTRVDAGGGWHDASDYLQYATTSANATFHMLAAYRDFPQVFEDHKEANGLDGKNGIADVLDEAKWGLDWLLKMHPEPHLMFNQIADDRDHASMRMPGEDPFYGRGNERPVYFISGEPQQRGKFLNNTTGTSSTAAKFTSAFNLGSRMFTDLDASYAALLRDKATSAYAYAQIKPGVTQTVSVKSPYIYAEENWVDDMELAAATQLLVSGDVQYAREGMRYARQEKLTPWFKNDTAAHYQWYPFINLGHYELAKQLTGKDRRELETYYKKGIEQVWSRARKNAFYRGVPFIWCSNNLTVAFAIQCIWYRELTGDDRFNELEQANVDWLFGCNPWGTSMVYGLPDWGDTPADPHSAFTHLMDYPIDGGLVDGPVYGSIFNNLIGIQLYNEDMYAAFQSDLAVYHDDYGDYSTNEPTMDGTASLIYLLAAKEAEAKEGAPAKNIVRDKYAAVIRGDSTRREVALVFTADSFMDGAPFILHTLSEQKIPGSFFLTGNSFKQDNADEIIARMVKGGHYLGPHSDAHLLYCDWMHRDSLLIARDTFESDLKANYDRMIPWGVDINKSPYFIPPYEWYNRQIVDWADSLGVKVINFTPGLRTAADYTYPEMGDRYWDSERILQSVLEYEQVMPSGLNGYTILIHLGTDPRRTDKFYHKLPLLIATLKERGYNFERIDRFLQ
jgi:peptidoglycan/xylan/chitin deacetylase (PgdA/CDA1 family)